MSGMEAKMDAVVRYCLAENEESRSAAAGRLRNLMYVVKADDPAADVEGEIRRILLEIGIPDRLKGHRYLICAISLAVEDEKVVNHMSKRMYPQIARLCGAEPKAAERCIRHAIEVAWIRGDWEVLNRYFGNTVSGTTGRPTNAEFIARVANIVRESMM